MFAVRALIGFFLCATVSIAAVDLRTLSGKAYSGELVGLSDKSVVLRTVAGQNVTTEVGDILVVILQPEGSLPASAKFSDIELIDGTTFHCSSYVFKGNQVELKLANSEQKLTLPLATVANVLNDAQDAATRQEWQEKHLVRKHSQDVLAIKVEGVINDLEGTLGDANAQGEIAFEYDSGGTRKKKDVSPAKVQGLIFVRTLAGVMPSPLCKVYDINQNVLLAASLVMTPNGFTVTTLTGAKIDYPRSSLVRFDYSNDKIVYLSDLKPAETIIKSRQGRRDTVHLDKSVDNGPLTLQAGQFYAKGLGLHSHTELVYNLDGKYQKFEAVLGMDENVGGDGQPVVKIEADGKELYAGTVTRKNGKIDLVKDIKGAKQLRVVVTSAGLFDFGDHVDLANAKLSK